MNGIDFEIGVGGDAERPRGPDHPYRDLTAIGYQSALDGHYSEIT